MPSRSRCYLVIPVSLEYRHHELSPCSQKLLNAAVRQAEGFVQVPVLPIGVIKPRGECVHLQTGKPIKMETFFKRGTHLFMNVGLLASDAPPIEKLLQSALQGQWAWSGQNSTNAVHAMAFSVQGFLRKTGTLLSHERLRDALLRLTACSKEMLSTVTPGHIDDFSTRLIPPSNAGIDHSPAMKNSGPFKRRPTVFDPRFLNTAFMEIVSEPIAYPSRSEGTDVIAWALLKHRDRSAVPWVFNAMVNEIEYRLGVPAPKAFPPEIHISTTGTCNLNCRFCNYEHRIARREYVLPEQIQKLDYLRHVQTLRLSSGLGEPSLNPHLTEIIGFLSKTFPHLQMGFFSNGLALNENNLLEALVGNVNWINISLNAASAESYRMQCHTNGFGRVFENLSRLHTLKMAHHNLMPLTMGSMVLNRRNLADLPEMPALCRQLGIDRLTAFPFSALGAHDPTKFGPEDTLAACMTEYKTLYEKTVEASEKQGVSLEIPIPASSSKGNFGTSHRKFYDFAGIESNEWPLGRFLTDLKFEKPEGSYCHFLWRYALIGSTNNTGHSNTESHFIYPCVGPLSSADLSRRTAFRFQGEKRFMKLWQSPVLNFLRKAQHSPGTCGVCDLCRNSDVRDPKHFKSLEAAVARFSAPYQRGEENTM